MGRQTNTHPTRPSAGANHTPSPASPIWYAVARKLFWITLAITLVLLLTPASAIVSAKVWVASWLPLAKELDALDASQYTDKIVHFSLFGMLGFWGVLAWRQPTARWQLLLALLLLAPFTELLQRWIPGRGASWGDIVADCCGLVVGALVAATASTPKRRNIPQDIAKC